MSELIKIMLIILVCVWALGVFFSWLLRAFYKCWRCDKKGARKVIYHYTCSPFGALAYYKYRCKNCGEESLNIINPLGEVKSIERARSEMTWKQVEIEFGHIK